MKKFTLIAAFAAITLSAFATERQTVLEETRNFPAKASARAEAKAPMTAAEIEGIYWLEAGIAISTQQATMQDVGAVMITGSNGNTVTVKDYVFPGLEFTATFDPITQTLTFPLNQSSTGNALTATIYEFDWRDGKAHEVVMLVDTKNHIIRYQGEVNNLDQFDTCIVLAKPGAEPMKQVAARVFVSYMWETNSTMQHRRWDVSTGSLSSPYYTPVYVSAGADNNIVVDNFLGRGFLNPVTFTPDANNTACYAINQTLMVNNEKYYLWGFDSNGTIDSTEIGFEGYYQPSDQSWVFLTGIIGLMNEEGTKPATDGIYYDVAFLVPFDPFAGVENVEIEDSKAPVEYFNLQGVRVNNPENGLYIRRQGSKAEKVYIR